ncbi:MAG: PKD domain-containing protein [Thermoplasmata archaeon]
MVRPRWSGRCPTARGTLAFSWLVAFLMVVMAVVVLGSPPRGAPPPSAPSNGATALSWAMDSLRAPSREAGPATPRIAPADAPVFPNEYTWANVSSLVAPGPPAGPASLAWDNASDSVLFFGGLTESGSIISNQTWSFANGVWSNLTGGVHGAPPPLFGASLAFDPATLDMILYGGENATDVPQNNTWTYSDGTWTNVTSTVGPSPPSDRFAPLAWDATDQELLYVGSPFGSISTAQTWAYRTTGWVNLTSVAPLGADLLGPMLAQDPSGGVLMVSVLEEGSVYVVGEYRFSGGTWTNLTSTLPTGFPLLFTGSLVYLPFTSAILAVTPAVGLSDGSVEYTPQEWEYADGLWTDIAIPTQLDVLGGSFLHSALDLTDQGVVAYGGTTVSGPLYSPYTFVLTPALTVSARASPTVVDAGDSVAFSGTLSGGFPAVQPQWVFSNVSGATTLDAAHAFTAPGLYGVVFSGTDRVGRTASQVVPIYVNPTPTVTASVAPSPAVVGSTVALVALINGGTAPYNYSWTFGDGLFSNDTTPTHVYAQAGTYPVGLRIRDATGATVNAPTVDLVVSAAPSSSTSPGSSSGVSLTSGWGLLLIAALVLVALVAAVFAVLWWRRGAGPPPTAPPPSGSVPPPVPPGVG